MTYSYKQFCSLLVCLALTCSTFGETIFVKANAIGENDGESWEDAYLTLSEALEEAEDEDQIWVAAGTYYPTTGTNRSISFILPNGVKILGGFPNTGNPNLGNRNPINHPTILSGDIDQDGDLANNSYTIIYTKDVNGSTILDGFTITGGNANESANDDFPVRLETGGAAWFNEASNLSNSNPTIKNCIFRDNYASNRGGAMFHKASSGAYANYILENCLFENNTADRSGGAIYNAHSGTNSECSPSVSNTNFINNTAGQSGGAIYNDGSYFGVVSGGYTNCNFNNNEASENEGGAIYNNAAFQGITNPTFFACNFTGNTATPGSGGAIFTDASGQGIANFRVTNCVFEQNISNVYGGAICNIISNQGEIKPIYTNCIFKENSATNGGATYSRGVFGSNLDIIIANCVFYKNQGSVGGAIYQNETGGTSLVTTKVSNSIFEQNIAGFSPTFHLTGPSSIGVNHSIFDVSNCLDLVQGDGTSESDCNGSNIFNQNPLFVDAENGNFQVTSLSPAIDAGSNGDLPSTVSVDFIGNPRIAAGVVDIGIYEMVNVNSDNDNDGILDANDNCPLVANAGQADIDGDGTGTACDCDDSIATGTSCSTGCSVFYLDNDNDGFGTPLTSVITCVVPAGYVANNQDFNDNDPTLFPNAPELCDGKDNNNNGQTDEGTDDDNDGVCNEDDICPGGDDTIDLNGNNIPDDCESQITLSCPSDITLNAVVGQNTAIATWTTPTASTDCNGGGAGGGNCTGDPIPNFTYKGTHNGHDYYLSDSGAFWTDAQLIAAANDANLVVINDQAENDFVKSIIGSNIVHIGLTDQVTEGEFKWVDDSDIDDFNNFEGTPGSQDYGIMYFWNGKWAVDGNFTKQYVIEKTCGGGTGGGLMINQTAGLDNGTAFPLGTTPVTYTATDECGGLRTCTFNVKVEATASNLSINCPANIIIDAAPGATEAIVTWSDPTTSSDCSGTISSTPSQASGTLFPIGTTIVSYNAMDECGSTTTCTFNVTVNAINSDISITCPADIVVAANPGAISKIITWANPSTTSNCTTGSVNIIASITSGSAFQTGTTTPVTLTATDDCGGAIACTFNVTVNEGTSIVNLACPSDIIVDASVGATSEIVTYQNPIGNTTCATNGITLELLNGFASGEAFPIGTTIVEYKGIDLCGSTDICSFTVTVNAPTPVEIQINCPADITETVTSPTGIVPVLWATPTGGSTCGTGGYAVTQTAGPASGSAFSAGSTVITYTATDNCGSSTTCSFTITVNLSNSDLNITCPSDINLTIPQGSGGGIATWAMPTATTTCVLDGGGGTPTCSGAVIAGFEYKGEYNGSDYYISLQKENWLTAKAKSEAAGGTLAGIENAEENAFIKDIVAGEIVFIGRNDMSTEGVEEWLNGEDATYNNFSNFTPNNAENDYTVFYHWDGTWDWVSNGTYKNYLMEVKCGGNGISVPTISQINGPASGSNFPVGATTVTYQAMDDCGNTTTCSFNVNVTETIVVCTPDTDGGQVSGNELICDPYDPQTITSTSLPTGGTGTIEYRWLKSENGCPTDISQAISNSNSPTYNPPFITTTTTYVRWSRRADCTDWVASNCITKTVDDCGTTTDYCDLSAEQPWQEWISRVEVADLDNISGKSLGYDDYTNLVANLMAGQEYTVNVTLTFSYNQWDETVYVWMDFNQDNDFNDPGELVLEQLSPSNGNGGAQPDVIVGAFTVPSNAVPGTTRMRVAMKREFSVNPCGDFVHGEVEDYSLNIAAGASNRVAPVLAFDAYPVTGSSILEWISNTTDLENAFEVERSTDNQLFERIEEVTVVYEGDSDSFYKITDEQPEIGENYYRIKQVFKDGKTTYTETKKIVYGHTSEKLHFYPNPAKEILYVETKDFQDTEGKIQIINMFGQVLKEVDFTNVTDAVIPIPLDRLENGMHSLLFKVAGKPVQTQLFIVEKLY